MQSGLLRRCVKGLPVGGDQRVLHMPEQGISRFGRLRLLMQLALPEMVQDSGRNGRSQPVAGEDVHAVCERRNIRRCGA